MTCVAVSAGGELASVCDVGGKLLVALSAQAGGAATYKGRWDEGLSIHFAFTPAGSAKRLSQHLELLHECHC